ncbi:F-box only protein 6-like isoform X2 [Curcuma longa]|uniref:F-box only protein 6-like isoform X2 n=1 Tax=Curcuma longa TaxID=136217 RepID=UPI003D9E84D6
MDEAAALRQVVRKIRELCQLIASPSLDRPHRINPRLFILEFNNPLEYDFCGLLMKDKSGTKMVEVLESPPCKRQRKGNPAKAISSISSDIMDQQIWKNFPEDLFEAVIARLPTESFFRFRTVCRKWNSLLSSTTFSHQIAEVPQLHPWFYAVTHENIAKGVMYNPARRKWHHISIPFLPTKTVFLPVASAGGLICFLDLAHKNFYVSNPLTGSFKELPPRSYQVWSRVAVGMILNGKTAGNGYKIMWLGCNGDHEIYDSIHNSWTHCAGFPPTIKLPFSLNFRSQTVSIGSTIYFMHTEPSGILAYDVAIGVWKQFLIPSPPHLTDHTLAEYEGQILLVGLVTKNAANCVYVWEMQKMTLLWKEVDRMPNIWCLELYGKHVRMTCLGNHGLLMLSLRSKRMNRLVICNLATKEWQRVPECLHPHGKKRQTIACGTALHPFPTALA